MLVAGETGDEKLATDAVGAVCQGPAALGEAGSCQVAVQRVGAQPDDEDQGGQRVGGGEKERPGQVGMPRV